jgi:hypothetical protein
MVKCYLIIIIVISECKGYIKLDNYLNLIIYVIIYVIGGVKINYNSVIFLILFYSKI